MVAPVSAVLTVGCSRAAGPEKILIENPGLLKAQRCESVHVMPLAPRGADKLTFHEVFAYPFGKGTLGEPSGSKSFHRGDTVGIRRFEPPTV